MLALYSRRYVILNVLAATPRVLYEGYAIMHLKHYMPFQTFVWIHEMLVRNAMKQKLLLNQIHVVEVCEAVWYKTFVRTKIYSAMRYYL